jgi:hypothetical protein
MAMTLPPFPDAAAAADDDDEDDEDDIKEANECLAPSCCKLA